MDKEIIQPGDTFVRTDVKYPAPLRVVRVFTNTDGITHVQLSRSDSVKDTFTISLETLRNRRYFKRHQG